VARAASPGDAKVDVCRWDGDSVDHDAVFRHLALPRPPSQFA